MKIYHLLNQEISTNILGCWEKHLNKYKSIVGYTITGTLFLKNPETDEYLVLYPSMPDNNCKAYGFFESLEDFENIVLKEEVFSSYGIYPIEPSDLDYLIQKVGGLENNEVYFPVPDPVIGGSGEIDTFSKGDVWIHTDIIGQNRGL